MEFEVFKTIYLAQVNKIFTIFNDKLQNNLAAHCFGWSAGVFDFKNYLEASAIRYYYCYKHFLGKGVMDKNNVNILDIGGFLCAFPLTLAKLGYQVSISENMKYYNDGLENIFNLAESSGVAIIDKDLVSENIPVGNFTHICCFALLEHLPSSPKLLLENIYNNLNPVGKTYIEVPNIAYWRNRWNLFKGVSPLTPIDMIYKSKIPFIGHHHEYTIGELRWLVHTAGFVISDELFFNYSIPAKFDIHHALCRKNIPAYLFNSCKEIMAIIGRKDQVI